MYVSYYQKLTGAHKGMLNSNNTRQAMLCFEQAHSRKIICAIDHLVTSYMLQTYLHRGNVSSFWHLKGSVSIRPINLSEKVDVINR